MQLLRSWLLTLGVLSVGLLSPVVAAEDHPSRPAILFISIDGFRADDLAGADRLGLKIPTLRRLVDQGTTGRRMIPVFPSVTYPCHTSLVTGCAPGRHGILANEIFQPLVDGRGDWYWYAKSIKVPTLYEALGAAGWSTAAVGWPVMVGAKVDWNVPEYWDSSNFDGTFVAKSREASTPGLIEGAQKRFEFQFDVKHVDEDKNLIARYIVLEHRPDLLLMHYSEMDKKQHLLGPGTPEVFANLEKIDGMIGELLDAYRQADLTGRLITCVVSDHGFERVDKEFKPNAVLRQAGLVDFDAGEKKITGWRAKAWVSGGSAAIVLADEKDTASLDKAREALAAYAGKPDSPIDKIIDRDELRRLDANPMAAFSIDPAPGFNLGRSADGDVVGPSFLKGMHGQLPDRPQISAVFVIAGPGIGRGQHLDKIRMVDVAPTLAHLAGVQLLEAQGKPIPLPAATRPG